MTMQVNSDIWILHTERSRFIDAFAAVEEAIFQLIDKNDLPRGQLLGQNIATLRKLPPSSKASKASVDQLARLLDRIGPIQAIRCDVVHGRMSPVSVSQGRTACFVNPQYGDSYSTVARIITEAQFSQLIAELTRIRADLVALARPFSPPPPSRAAAGGP